MLIPADSSLLRAGLLLSERDKQLETVHNGLRGQSRPTQILFSGLLPAWFSAYWTYFLLFHLIYSLLYAWESNPLSFRHLQNRFGTFGPGVPAKVATRSRPIHDYRHVEAGNSGRLWHDPRTGKAQKCQPGTPQAQHRFSQESQAVSRRAISRPPVEGTCPPMYPPPPYPPRFTPDALQHDEYIPGPVRVH